MEKNTTTHSVKNYLLGNSFLILTVSNEVAFLINGAVSHRQKLEPRIMEVLKILLEGNGQVILREKIIERVWGDYGGGEEGLIQAVSKLRRIFQDNAKSPKVIETIPKKGYRLLLEIRPTNFKWYEGKNGLANGEIGQNISPTQQIIIQHTGLFTGFIERLTQPKFLLAFLAFSVVLIMVLGILSYMLFWGAVAFGMI